MGSWRGVTTRGLGWGRRRPARSVRGPARGRARPFHLPFGVRVWLCRAHRDPGFVTRRSGRDLVVSLMHVWSAAGCLTQRRRAALDAQLRRVQAAGSRRERCPGSYSWPALRAEAEARFAAGERPAAVFIELRDRHRGRPGRGALASHHAALVRRGPLAGAAGRGPAAAATPGWRAVGVALQAAPRRVRRGAAAARRPGPTRRSRAGAARRRARRGPGPAGPARSPRSPRRRRWRPGRWRRG